MSIWPFTARAEIARLKAENEELQRRLSAGGRAAHQKQRSRVASKTAQLLREIKHVEMS